MSVGREPDRGLAYLDFEVEVGPGAGGVYPLAIRSPAGEARELMRLPLDAPELERRLGALERAVRRPDGHGAGGRRVLPPQPEAGSGAGTPAEAPAQELGSALFEALLPGAARSRYEVSRQMARDRGRGLRLRLRLQDPALAALPWEFLYDVGRAAYVCLSPRTPLVRHLDAAQPVVRLAVTPPLRVLAVVASPPDLPPLQAARERAWVERALAPLRAAGRVEVAWLEGQAATWRGLQEALRPGRGAWHILHFVGHGGFEPSAGAEGGGEGYLALAGEGGGTYRLSATDLGNLLRDREELRLAVLNACEGAQGDGRDVFAGTAATLARTGVLAVVAMRYVISDLAAVEFARTLYDALAGALPVDAAVAEARTAVRLASPGGLEWGTPVLYLRAPDAVLFDLEGAAPPRDGYAEPAADDRGAADRSLLMDPLAVVVSALALDATALQPVKGRAIKDGCAGLRALLVRKFGSKSPRLERTLADHAEDPETYKAPMEKVLKDADADADREVVERATALLKVAEAAQPGVTGGLVGQINARGGRVVLIGRDQTGTINMGDAPQAGESGVT